MILLTSLIVGLSTAAAQDIQAQDDGLALTVAGSAVVNDPFLKRRGVRTNVVKRLSPMVGVEATAGFYPDLGESDLTDLTKQISDGNNVAPDISRLMYVADVGVVFYPLRGSGQLLGQPVAYDISAGVSFGVAHTKDDGTVSGLLDGADNQCPDLSSLNSGSEQALFCQTQIQNHPTSGSHLGLVLYLSDSMAVSGKLKSATYIETVQSTMLEMKTTLFTEVGATFLF